MVVRRTSMLNLMRVMKIIFNSKTEFQEIIRFLETLFFILASFIQPLLSEDYRHNR